MAHVFPFRAVRPDPEIAPRVSCPPYDVMSAAEARAMAADNPLSFLRVIRSEIDLPPNTDPHSDKVYETARQNYQAIKRNAPMKQSETAHFHVYRMEMNGHTQAGIAATPAVADYDAGVIKKHERTRQAKEDDRTRHILELRAQTGMVFLTYRDSDNIDELVEQTTTDTTPSLDFTACDGIRHTLWTVDERLNASIVEAFHAVPALYIADGHHRAASASRVRGILDAEHSEVAPDAPWTRFLAVIFPASQLRILPYNRLIKNLAGQTPAQVLERIRTVADVADIDVPIPSMPGMVCMYMNGAWKALTFNMDRSRLSPVQALDVSLLQDQVLAPILGIDDPRTNELIEFVGGIRGTDELVRRVDNGEADVAFSMYPTTVDQLMAISDADDIMPPKSTWFEPKLRDGLLVHELH